ncbi:DUF1080 domain-containing protein [bacterium]|nr:DUF1080 domain-containing protein [bacterium]
MTTRLGWGLWACLLILGTQCRAEEAHNKLTPEEVADGWLLLFDGETLFGWQAELPAFEKMWMVKDGTITSDPAAGFNHLKSHAAFSDFVMKLDFRINKGGNSGIFFRGAPVRGQQFVGLLGISGYEAQVDDNDPRGLLYQTGGLYDVAPAKKLIKGEDQWRSYEITADGDHITTKINGELICDTMQKKFRFGHIGLQQHNPGSVIEYRNIKLKPLGLKPIFNGKDLSGWKVASRDPDPSKLQAEWAVKDGAIHVDVPKKEGVKQGGQGQLETDANYKDFILQLDIRVNGKFFNSGVFYRSLPGTVWVGYESQIRNQYMGKRDRPIDFGTGGIYNLKPTRLVSTDDGVYFKKTIVVHGNQFSVWLDGYQVTDFADTRKPDPNPRNGYYAGEGKIALQSHDPTTNLDFKNVKIVELPTGK